MENQASTPDIDIGDNTGEAWMTVPKKSLGRGRHLKNSGITRNGSSEPHKIAQKGPACFSLLAEDEEECVEDELQNDTVSSTEGQNEQAREGSCSELADSGRAGKPQPRKKPHNDRKQSNATSEDFDVVLAEEKELAEEREAGSPGTNVEAVRNNVTSSHSIKRRTKAMTSEDDATSTWSLMAMVLASATNLMADAPADLRQSAARTDRAALRASAASEQEKMRSRCHSGASKTYATAPRQQRKAVGRRG
mmetsp:Transcript_63792/g.118514  ORF Transcript_63792/g.118514 Transcript_63792/m.118514 type:complete len:250 (+) Transcript_63792:67-816(+)